MQVEARDGEITIHDERAQRIYYLGFARGILSAINWAPHLDRELSLRPGERARLSYKEVLRGLDDDEAVVYLSATTLRDGKRVPAEPEAVVLTL